jgi:hypothetical protein
MLMKAVMYQCLASTQESRESWKDGIVYIVK